MIVRSCAAVAFSVLAGCRAESEGSAPPTGTDLRASRGADAPAALASRVLKALEARLPDSVQAYVPGSEAAELVRQSIANDWILSADAGDVLEQTDQEAILFLAAHPLIGNWGDETILARGFSGLYRAERIADSWFLIERLPIDLRNEILSHRITATLDPAVGLMVVDTMLVSSAEDWGFALRLNHRSEIHALQVRAGDLPYRFGGGVLWFDSPREEALEVVLRYSLNVAADTIGNPNSGRFAEHAGHVRNQYFWHPFFDFDSQRDRADFDVRVRAPAAYHVTTSLPETSDQRNGVREVHACSSDKAFALTLMYDRAWRPASLDLDHMRFRLYATEDFTPSVGEMRAAFERTYEILVERFGPPRSRYFAVAQGRARPGEGWFFRSNDLIVTGNRGGQLSEAFPRPRAYFPHELAHGWTAPTGPGANLLTEGWATFAESLVLERQFGRQTLAAFWESQRNRYETAGFDGSTSLLNDPRNAGISYSKGAWVFRSLRHVLGDAAFEAGLAEYMSIPAGEPAGVAELTSALTRHAGWEVASFLEPWLAETRIPRIDATVEGRQLVVRQTGATFVLPLEIELRGPTDTARVIVDLSRAETTVEVGRDAGTFTRAYVDPDHRYLLKRSLGELARLALSAPSAEEVLLVGDFSPDGLAAERTASGQWTVDVPLTEGRYIYHWVVDGSAAVDSMGNTRWQRLLVRPIGEVSSPFPSPRR